MIDRDKLISLLVSKDIPVKKTQRYKTDTKLLAIE